MGPTGYLATFIGWSCSSLLALTGCGRAKSSAMCGGGWDWTTWNLDSKPPRKKKVNTGGYRSWHKVGNGWNKRMQKENKDVLLEGHLPEKLIDAFSMPKSRVSWSFQTQIESRWLMLSHVYIIDIYRLIVAPYHTTLGVVPSCLWSTASLIKEILLFGKVRKIGIEQLCTHTLSISLGVHQSRSLGGYDHITGCSKNDWIVSA